MKNIILIGMIFVAMLGILTFGTQTAQSMQLTGSASSPGQTASVSSSFCSLSRDQVISLIQTQGKNKDAYYLEELSYEAADLDDDPDAEIIAKIVGGVHLGTFFIFDKDADGAYQLIAEQDWKVEQWDLDHPLEIAGKKIFPLETRTGGTGISICTMHLCYLEQGKFVEAWQGTIQKQCWQPGDGYFLQLGSCQVDRNDSYRLYVWDNTWQYQLAPDGVTPLGEVKTTAVTEVYWFDGTCFIKEGDAGAVLLPL